MGRDATKMLRSRAADPTLFGGWGSEPPLGEVAREAGSEDATNPMAACGVQQTRRPERGVNR